MNTWKVILATIVIFGAGVITGSFALKVFQDTAIPNEQPRIERRDPPPNPRLNRPEFILRLKKPLELTPEQVSRIEEIIRQSQARTEPIWESIKPQMHAEVDRLRKEIKAELTPEQKEKFEKIMRERRKSDDERRNGKRDDDSPRKDQDRDEHPDGPPLPH